MKSNKSLELYQIKAKVISHDKNMKWLISKYSKSKSYFYKAIDKQIESEIKEIKEILDTLAQ